MKRFLVACVCLVAILSSVTTLGNNITEEDKPPITKPASTDDVI